MKPDSPCTVERASRSVIERKLLVALNSDENQVAIIATKQDLEDILASLDGIACGVMGSARRKDLADGMRQLLLEAFHAK